MTMSAKRASGYIPRGIQTNDAQSMSHSDIMGARLEADAVAILESVLHRKRWTAHDRDAIAARIRDVVTRELGFAGFRK